MGRERSDETGNRRQQSDHCGAGAFRRRSNTGSPLHGAADDIPLTQRLSVKPLRGEVYWTSGGISNTGVVIGDTGVIAIDAQMFLPTARKQLSEKLTPRPVNVLILTHSDPDHINGLPAYPRGIEIISQENAKAEMQRLAADPYSNGFPPDPAIKDYMPTRTVRDTESVVLDGVPLVLIHTAPAHTDGDPAIYLPSQKIVFAGDLITPAISPYPGIHLNKHGSSLGWFKSTQAILALDADIYVSGHGELLSKDELTKRLKDAEERRAEIKMMFDQGKTMKEAKTALHDVPLNGSAAMFPTFTESTVGLTATALAGTPLAQEGRTPKGVPHLDHVFVMRSIIQTSSCRQIPAPFNLGLPKLRL